MKRGWFVGYFTPAVIHTKTCEVALKKYRAGERESLHYHKIATEMTLVVSGRIYMCSQEFNEGDIIVVEPGEKTDFISITDSINVVVKIPSAFDDKYFI